MHKVDAKGILSSSNGMNIYRGCQHNCIYCDSRSLCYGMEHDFEDIEVKQNAPFLLEKALKSKRKKCMIGTGAMSDPYIPLEHELKLTRQCLEIVERYGFGATVLTKSSDVLRDLDLFRSINSKSKAVIQMTLTTYDETMCKIIEPNVSSTKERFEALKIFRDNGIPTVMWLDPFLPFINDTEENIRGLLDYCVKAKVKGIICFDIGLTLRSGNREYFYKQLDRHFPKLKEKYIGSYGNSYEITSRNRDKLMKIITDVCRKNGIMYNVNEVFAYLHRFESKEEQLSLFDMG
ncbi:radical SAM protein [Ruminococcus sp.]|uniref:SPL family radical SAM protein n=1 Tax=Ruminococcus sp. TaxID=41978 RepID=UPI00260DB42C|nr:radical SAM protein [Ruminococcus sp.]MDD6989841.1 radical SAM protein [Ruminococcus sp.]MDY6201628.1 radical SAM protein [Ruminococcus sp.]